MPLYFFPVHIFGISNASVSVCSGTGMLHLVLCPEGAVTGSEVEPHIPCYPRFVVGENPAAFFSSDVGNAKSDVGQYSLSISGIIPQVLIIHRTLVTSSWGHDYLRYATEQLTLKLMMKIQIILL